MRARSTRPPVGLGGRYRIERLVGQGERADVFRAWDRESNRPVAVKWVRERVDLSLYPRWRADADELRRLAHPGLVRERDHGTEDGRPYLVTDLVGSSTLRAVCEARSVPPDVCASVCRQLAVTLRHLHDNGVTHGYLSADKILVRQGKLVVRSRAWLDCGPWVPKDPPPVSELAPELRGGEESTAAGDIWALGALILGCLIGKPACGRSGAAAVQMLPEPWPVLLPMMLDGQPQCRPTAGQVAAVVSATGARASVPHPSAAVRPIPVPRATVRSPQGRTTPAWHWSRATALTTITAAAAIALLVVGVRVVRAAEEHPTLAHAESPPARVSPAVGAVTRQPPPTGPTAVVTPSIRSVALVKPLRPGGQAPASRPEHGRAQPHGGATGPHHSKPATMGRPPHGRAVGRGQPMSRLPARTGAAPAHGARICDWPADSPVRPVACRMPPSRSL